MERVIFALVVWMGEAVADMATSDPTIAFAGEVEFGFMRAEDGFPWVRILTWDGEGEDPNALHQAIVREVRTRGARWN